MFGFISKKRHYRRVTELLEANNREVDRRRDAEHQILRLEEALRILAIRGAIQPQSVQPADSVQRVSIAKDGEWATMFFDDATGTFACESSFGAFNYTWRARAGRTVLEFVRSLSFDYFMTKTRGGSQVFDREGTIDGLKSQIIERRKDRDITKDQARDAWDDIEDIPWEEHENMVMTSIGNHRSIYLALGADDWWHCARHKTDPALQRFWDVLWPEFLAQTSGATVAAEPISQK